MKTKLILATMATILTSGAGAQTQPAPAKKVLVAYYSHSGNTREVARQIAGVSGGELFEIVPVTPYPSDYRTVVDQAKKEIEAGARPALKSRVEDMSQYDVIFIGSPCWWATVAPPVATFLISYDFAGKTVVPFMTHEGSRMGRRISANSVPSRRFPTGFLSAAVRWAVRKMPSKSGSVPV